MMDGPEHPDEMTLGGVCTASTFRRIHHHSLPLPVFLKVTEGILIKYTFDIHVAALARSLLSFIGLACTRIAFEVREFQSISMVYTYSIAFSFMVASSRITYKPQTRLRQW